MDDKKREEVARTPKENPSKKRKSKKVCVWKPIRKISPTDTANTNGTLAYLSAVMTGSDGVGGAGAMSTLFVDWFASTDAAGAVSGTYEIKLERVNKCENPKPVADLEATSTLKFKAFSSGPSRASAAGYCTISGDLSLLNKSGAVSGSKKTSTQLTLGPLTINPMVAADGKVEPPDSIVVKSATKKKPNPSMTAASSFALKAMAWDDTGKARANASTKLDGSIKVKCESCGATATIEFW